MLDPIAQKIYVFGSADALYKAMASHLAELIIAREGAQDNFNLVLSGGQTPRPLYILLAKNYRKTLPWDRVRLYWGDERCVPQDNPESNYWMVQQTLLNELPILPKNVFPMPASQADPEEAALSYEASLKTHFRTEWPRFDLILLGLGADGHTEIGGMTRPVSTASTLR